MTAAEVEDLANLRMFVRLVGGVDMGDYKVSDESEEEDDEDVVLVIAGERAHRFSDLQLKFDEETGSVSRRQRTMYGADEHPEEARTGKINTKRPISRTTRKPIRLIARKEKFDFVSPFRDTPVIGLNWGSFCDLMPSVKCDLCRQLVQECTCTKEKGKGKGNKVTIEEVQDEQEVSAMATD